MADVQILKYSNSEKTLCGECPSWALIGCNGALCPLIMSSSLLMQRDLAGNDACVTKAREGTVRVPVVLGASRAKWMTWKSSSDIHSR